MERFFGLPFNLGSSFARRTPVRVVRVGLGNDPTLTKEERENRESVFSEGCKYKRIEWARIESNLPPINIDVRSLGSSIKIGKCSEKFQGASWVKLVTNAGEKLLSMEDDHYIQFNSQGCFPSGVIDPINALQNLRGIKIETTLNPTCESVTCKLKQISWARIESNLHPIGLDVNRRHVIGRCSKEFPGMEWARLVTNDGSAQLDLNFDNEVIFNAYSCQNKAVGAKITKHRECLPPQKEMNDILITTIL